jgi:ribokinase
MTTHTTWDVVGLGHCTLDYLALVEAYPLPVNRKTEIRRFAEAGGGPAATAMVALARLGAEARLVSKVADDSRGQLILTELAAEGVDLAGMRVEAGRSSQISLIFVDAGAGTRTIAFTRGDLSCLTPDELDRGLITSGRILHLDGLQMEASLVAAQWAREAGVLVMLDAGSVRAGMAELVRLSDYVVASEVFANDFAPGASLPEAARCIYQAGEPYLKAAVVTAGERGGVGLSPAGEFTYPGFPVEVVDTTGAGDVFHGAFDYGLLQGWPLPETARFASAVAALKCRALGGRQAIPTLAEAKQFLGNWGT